MNNNFKKLVVWQKSVELVEKVYIATKKLPREEVYNLTSQIRRAALSIPSNIAEGSRRNNQPEFNQFLGIARGSAAELETQLLIAQKLYPKIDFGSSEKLLVEVQKMLNSFYHKFNTSNISSIV